MRKRVFILFGALALFAGCQVDRYNESPLEDPSAGFEVELESILPDAGPETKTLADDQHLVVWHNDDRVSVFEKKEFWEEYRYIGRTGTVGGRLKKVENDDPATGDDLDYYYAVYPHSELNGFDNGGRLLLTIPREQPYEEFSFGRGTNVMVSVSETNSFKFKNVGGYLVFKLYGEGISVSSVRLVSKNGQKLTGDIDVVASLRADPVATISTGNYANTFEDAIIVCDPPVALGATPNDYKEFWFVLPPMTLNGYSIEVTTSDGGVWTKSTVKNKEIKRNVYSPLSAMEITAESLAPIAFADNNVKAVLVDAFDLNGDGELSYSEAAAVTDLGEIFKGNTEITSFDELQYFTGIQEIPEMAFFGCTSLRSVIIPNSVTAILTNAFTNSGLTSVFIPASVSYLSENPFNRCAALETIVVDEANEYFDSRNGCNAVITKKEYLNNTGTIGTDWLMVGCKNTVIPESVVTIFNLAFEGCTGLTSITIPNSVTKIGTSAFSYCSGLETINFGNCLRTIEWTGFTYCSSLRELVLPGSLELISNAFSGCNSLESVTIYALNPPAGFRPFPSDNDIFVVYVPAESVEAYKSAQNWELYKDKIQAIPDGVDMGNGLLWATCNIGAGSPEDYGYYFAWGETEAKEVYSYDNYSLGYFVPEGSYTFKKYKLTDGLTELEASDDVATSKWGNRWCIPTAGDWQWLKDHCAWVETSNYNGTGVAGYTVTATNGNSIFLPYAGYQSGESDYNVGTFGLYWSSSLYTDDGEVSDAKMMVFYSGSYNLRSNPRVEGLTVRPVVTQL